MKVIKSKTASVKTTIDTKVSGVEAQGKHIKVTRPRPRPLLSAVVPTSNILSGKTSIMLYMFTSGL